MLLPGKNWGMYKITPFRKSSSEIASRLKEIPEILLYSTSITITGIIIVNKKLESIKLQISSGRLRRFLGIRAIFRARDIFASSALLEI